MDDLLILLEKHAEFLNAINKPVEGCEVFYEIMSGALVWRDETNDVPSELIDVLRVIAAYRTSLILNNPEDAFKTIWDRAMELFPDYIGFLPERRTPNPELLEIYRQGDVSLRKCLRDSDREFDADTEFDV